MSEQHPSKGKEISAFLSVIFGGGACALLVAVALVYFYGPSGLYEAKYSLLSPDMLHELKYQDVNPKTGSRSFFTFDAIDFTYYDTELGRWKNVAVDKEQYQKFYETIVSDVSVSEDDYSVGDQFVSGYPAMLRIIVHSDQKRDDVTKTFQEVTFSYNGEYYRIELHQEAKEQAWAYFFHKDIYQTAIEILK